jgi:hypothetical protein
MKVRWLLGTILILPMCLSAQDVKYVTISAPAGTTVNSISGISASGMEMVGAYSDGNPFLLSNGKFSDIPVPSVPSPSNFSVAAAVNDMGIVAGSYCPDFCYRPADPPLYGFAFNGRKKTKGGASIVPYVVPGPKETLFKAINNDGEIVGNYQDWGCDGNVAGCNRRGFLLRDGHLSTILFPGSVATFAAGINNRGEIVGTYVDVNGGNSFTLSKGVYRRFDTVPGGNLIGINDSGDVIGWTGSGSFLLGHDGAFHAILYPGSAGTSVTGISNRNRNKVGVVGTYTDSTSASHGFYAVVTLR